MQIALFKDLLDCTERVVGAIRAMAHIPRAEREKYRAVLDETYTLLDTTLNMVTIKLGNIVLIQDDNQMLNEAATLANWQDWEEAERRFGLCHALRATLAEAERLPAQITGSVSVGDWDALKSQMNAVLNSEGELAVYVTGHFQEMWSIRMEPEKNPPAQVRKQLFDFREVLKKQRQRLLEQERELVKIV